MEQNDINVNSLQPGIFEILGHCIPGYWNPENTWNGFARPYIRAIDLIPLALYFSEISSYLYEKIIVENNRVFFVSHVNSELPFGEILVNFVEIPCTIINGENYYYLDLGWTFYHLNNEEQEDFINQ